MRWTGEGDLDSDWETGTLLADGTGDGEKGAARASRRDAPGLEPETGTVELADETGTEVVLRADSEGTGRGSDFTSTGTELEAAAGAAGAASSGEGVAACEDIDTSAAAPSGAELSAFRGGLTGGEGPDGRSSAGPRSTGADSRAAEGDFNLSQPATLCSGDPHHRQVPSLLRQSRSQCPAFLQYLQVTVGHLEIRWLGAPHR